VRLRLERTRVFSAIGIFGLSPTGSLDARFDLGLAAPAYLSV
jgi:hypothetical protein